eukprot:1088567-Amphidinium_carterae.1
MSGFIQVLQKSQVGATGGIKILCRQKEAGRGTLLLYRSLGSRSFWFLKKTQTARLKAGWHSQPLPRGLFAGPSISRWMAVCSAVPGAKGVTACRFVLFDRIRWCASAVAGKPASFCVTCIENT